MYLAVDLDLFVELVKSSPEPLNVTDLAARSKASFPILEKLLRYLASVGYIANTGPNEYKANQKTHVFASPLARPGMIHVFDICSPAVQAFPSFLAATDYQDITNSRRTPFQEAFNTSLGAFEYISQQPKEFAAMQTVMTVMQSSDWIKDFNLLNDAADKQNQSEEHQERPFFVDVGGGNGHQLLHLRDKHPHLNGRLVLQDLPQAVEKLAPIEGVKAVAQNFFDKQSIEGANFYYLRHVLHDWSDDESIKILKLLAAVLGKDSYILIDEIVLPDTNAHWQATMRDMTMSILFGGKERSRSQWESLVEQAGLSIVQIHTYSKAQSDSVIVLALA